MSSDESMGCYLENKYDNGKPSSWTWPREPTPDELKILMSIMLEISVRFFFEHFIYTFGNMAFLQSEGGPIRARLTMCIARLTMQDWWEKIEEICQKSNIEILLRAIYVDDSRIIVEILKPGVVFYSEKGLFIYSDNRGLY